MPGEQVDPHRDDPSQPPKPGEPEHQEVELDPKNPNVPPMEIDLVEEIVIPADEEFSPGDSAVVINL